MSRLKSGSRAPSATPFNPLRSVSHHADSEIAVRKERRTAAGRKSLVNIRETSTVTPSPRFTNSTGKRGPGPARHPHVSVEVGEGERAAQNEQADPPDQRSGEDRLKTDFLEPEPVGEKAGQPRNDDQRDEDRGDDPQHEPPEGSGWEAGARALGARMVCSCRTRTCTPERRNTKGHPLDALLVVRLFGVDRLRSTHERGAVAAFVVITTTPYDASGPYRLSAACPLITPDRRDLVVGQRRHLIALESHTVHDEEKRNLGHAGRDRACNSVPRWLWRECPRRCRR